MHAIQDICYKGKLFNHSGLMIRRENGCQKKIYYIFQVQLSVIKYNLYDCEVALFIFPVKKSLSKYVWVGKNGLKTNVSQEISRLLQKKRKKNLGQHVKNEHFQYNLSPMHKSC